MRSLENLKLEPMTEKEEVLAVNSSLLTSIPGSWPLSKRSLRLPKTLTSDTNLKLGSEALPGPRGHCNQHQWNRNSLYILPCFGDQINQVQEFPFYPQFWALISCKVRWTPLSLWPSVTPLNARTKFSLWLLCANKCCLMHRSRVLHGCLIRHTLCNQQ